LARRTRLAGPLDLRSQAILRAVIEEYVTSAVPVGSQALVARYGLGVSSATVRHVLAELEDGGLLTHPHTSAGRIPTDEGYRYYVESIVDAVPLPPVEQLMIRHQFGQVEFANEHWFRLAATGRWRQKQQTDMKCEPNGERRGKRPNRVGAKPGGVADAGLRDSMDGAPDPSRS
jgi:heat-inducible transcriptional repressor